MIEYTRHAKRRMKWRKISESEIQFTLNTPDNVQPLGNSRYHAHKTIEGKILRVTYVKEDRRIKIVTALWKGE